MKAVQATLGYLRDRGVGGGAPGTMPGGASFAYVFGYVLVFLLGVELVSGVALAAFYAPTATDAWGSVAYVQDQAALGWLVRGVHFHGASVIAIVGGIHLLQTALCGAYKKPRELVWWLGILLYVIILAWAVTGYVLRWDQAGYWANKVEVGIAAATPVVGGLIQALAIGGNDYGNLTLTRFYSLHVLILPAIVAAIVIGHIALSRKLGATPLGDRERSARPRWPEQTVRNAVAIAMVFTVLMVYVVSVHGADLAAPADPGQAYDARPFWYFRWLFELRQLAGGGEKVVALAAPVLVIGALVALPLVDRAPGRDPRKRKAYLGGLAGLVGLICLLTVISLVRDAGDPELAKRETKAAERADLARKLARDNGVPATGAGEVFMTAPMARARALYATRCKGCHDAASKDRKGPVIAPGHGDRSWLTAFLKNPSGDEFWGRTKLAQTDASMKSFAQLQPRELEDVVEMLFAESGASGVDEKRRAHGIEVFEAMCTDCHARDEGMPGSSAPGLGGLGSRAYYLSFITNPKSALHMGHDRSQMPRFDRELPLADRDVLAAYLVWLRGATPADLAALDPL